MTASSRTGLGRIVCIALGLMALAGCGSTGNLRDQLGMGRHPPNEFDVVAQAPLVVPKQVTLPVPQADAPAAAFHVSPSAQAELALFGQDKGSQDKRGQDKRGQDKRGASPSSAGEAALLANADVGTAQPGIRATVDREAVATAAAGKHWVDTLLFWKTPAQPGTVVDPTAEQRRLREDAALGKPLTAGETPMIVRRQRRPL